MRDFARHVKNVAEMSQHLHHVTKLAMSVLLTRPMRAKEKKVLGGHGLRAKVVGRGLHHNFFFSFWPWPALGFEPPGRNDEAINLDRLYDFGPCARMMVL